MIGELFLNNRIELRPGDCRDVLLSLPDTSIDSVVTDPPYALVSIVKRYGADGAAPAKGDVYGRAAAGFMGQQWDTGETAFAVEFWREVMRVLKPGGHVVAFSGTRTYHRLAVAIEDAGFEIRDQLAWAYGSGFPKSHDVSKGIDKRRVEDFEPVRRICRVIRAAMDAKGLKSRHLVQYFDGCHPRLIDHWAARDTDSQPSLPTLEQWEVLRDVLGLGAEHDGEVRRLNERKGEFGGDWHAREITGEVAEWSDRSNYEMTSRDGLRRDVASSQAARDWQGWGTALKPAWEPIVFARKPLVGTVAANVLSYGTGAINIDGTRNGGDGGRWPANILHDGSADVVGAFPADGSESAARFFYSAKADAHDRIGSKHPTIKPVDLMQWLCRLVTPKGGVVLDPFAGSGTTGEAAWREGFRAILVEMEEEFCEDIRRRLHLAERPTQRAAVAKAKGKVAGLDGLPLFGGLE